jgi:hypothetical protein
VHPPEERLHAQRGELSGRGGGRARAHQHPHASAESIEAMVVLGAGHRQELRVVTGAGSCAGWPWASVPTRLVEVAAAAVSLRWRTSSNHSTDHTSTAATAASVVTESTVARSDG